MCFGVKVGPARRVGLGASNGQTNVSRGFYETSCFTKRNASLAQDGICCLAGSHGAVGALGEDQRHARPRRQNVSLELDLENREA